MSTNESPAKKKLSFCLNIGIGILIVGAFVGLIAVGALLPFYFRQKTDPLGPNEIGDSFGLLNALMSSLAFMAVLATLWMQRQELALQRQEMRDSREELRKSAEAQERSEKRLAATVALNALESLRESASTRSQNGSLFQQCEATLLGRRLEILITELFQASGIHSGISISSPLLDLGDQLVTFLGRMSTCKSTEERLKFAIELESATNNSNSGIDSQQMRNALESIQKAAAAYNERHRKGQGNTRHVSQNTLSSSDDSYFSLITTPLNVAIRLCAELSGTGRHLFPDINATDGNVV